MRNGFRYRILPALAVGVAVFLPTMELRADELIRSVQKKLHALGFYKGKVDGAPGSMTNAAIRRFQLDQKLKVTGQLNHQTLSKLGLEGRAQAPDYSAIGRFFVGGPLAGADANSQVESLRQIQGKLAAAGFYAGPHNGMPSSTLASALKEWQTVNGLNPSGRIDSATASKMAINP